MKYTLTLFIALALSSSAIAKNTELKLITAEIPPYTRLDGEKQTGVVLELVQAMAKELKRPPTFEFLPWKRALEMAKDDGEGNDIYGIIPLARSAERESHYKWIALLLTDDVLLVTKKDRKIDASTIEKAKNLTVGALRGSPGEQLLRDKGFTKIEATTEDGVNAQKLQSGNIDAWLAGRMSAISNYQKAGFNPKELGFGLIMRVQELYLGASTSTPAAEEKKWQGALEKIKKNGTYKKIVSKYK